MRGGQPSAQRRTCQHAAVRFKISSLLTGYGRYSMFSEVIPDGSPNKTPHLPDRICPESDAAGLVSSDLLIREANRAERPSPSARLASDPMRSTRKFHDDVCNNLFRRNDRADLAMDSGSTVTDALPAPTVQAVQAGEERPRPPETRRHTRPVPARRRTAAAKATGSGEKRSHPAT